MNQPSKMTEQEKRELYRRHSMLSDPVIDVMIAEIERDRATRPAINAHEVFEKSRGTMLQALVDSDHLIGAAYNVITYVPNPYPVEPVASPELTVCQEHNLIDCKLCAATPVKAEPVSDAELVDLRTRIAERVTRSENQMRPGEYWNNQAARLLGAILATPLRREPEPVKWETPIGNLEVGEAALGQDYTGTCGDIGATVMFAGYGCGTPRVTPEAK